MDIYQSPWTLIITAVALFCIITIFRNVKPEMRRWWQLLIPFVVLAAAFGIDYLVETDKEKITARIHEARAAVLNRKPKVIIEMIDEDYQGQHRYDRNIIMRKAQQYFSRPFAEKIRINYNEITITGDEATSQLSVTVHFDESADAAQFVTLAIIQANIGFVRRGDDWMVKSVEIEKVNNKEPPRW
jgi:hypothetical protein